MPTAAATILLVDDEESIQKLLTYPLERDGYRVVQARNGEEALKRFDEEPIDLVVLDVMLPRMDGLEVCKQLRATSFVPIIMLTARDDEVDKVLGLELGADDYITKPFSIREFRSRVRAALRRAATPRHDSREPEPIAVDGLTIDPSRRTVDIGGEPVQLTYVEFELLRTLASRPGRVFTRQALLEAVWGGSDYRDPRTIDVHVRHLREKLERDASEPEIILTVRGVGYRFREPVNPLRSVGARLSLALLLVVAGSLTAVYLVVIPSLESRLIDSKITQLEQTVKSETLRTDALAHEINHDPFWFQDQRETTNARLVFYEVLTNEPRALKVTADSSGGRNSLPIEGDPVALRASVSGQPHHGTVKRSGVRYAEVAWPYPNGWVLMLSAPLGDALESVSVAKQRLLLAGGIVLGVVLVVGYFAASLFARRIRRLERAAERIASGRFDEPIVDSGQDEVGNLARGFERMRLRLAQLDGARREFIANASHELRTPLFALGGFLELLDDEDLDPATREDFLATMRDQVRRLTKLAGELLDLSRLDAGQIEIHREPVSLGAMARLVADEFAAVAERTGHPLAVAADEDAFALADEQRVVQIVRNLVENALVHTPAETSVLVRIRRSAAGASLTVEDAGPGMPPEQAAHVFDRFYRGDGTQASGSGLGLAIARELARAMDGTLELEVEHGRTVFRLTLPAADATELEQPELAVFT